MLQAFYPGCAHMQLAAPLGVHSLMNIIYAIDLFKDTSLKIEMLCSQQIRTKVASVNWTWSLRSTTWATTKAIHWHQKNCSNIFIHLFWRKEPIYGQWVRTKVSSVKLTRSCRSTTCATTIAIKTLVQQVRNTYHWKCRMPNSTLKYLFASVCCQPIHRCWIWGLIIACKCQKLCIKVECDVLHFQW